MVCAYLTFGEPLYLAGLAEAQDLHTFGANRTILSIPHDWPFRTVQENYKAKRTIVRLVRL